MASAQLYDEIGATYTATRRTEPRIAARIWAALGDARTVLNVGAGPGSYEPPDRRVLAVEPSALMRSQRSPGAAPCVATRCFRASPGRPNGTTLPLMRESRKLRASLRSRSNPTTYQRRRHDSTPHGSRVRFSAAPSIVFILKPYALP